MLSKDQALPIKDSKFYMKKYSYVIVLQFG